MPDYNEWLTPERLAETEKAWAQIDRTELIKAIMEHEPASVVEFCCGTGWIPLGLPMDVEYLGFDANEGCIKYAEKKNPLRQFQQADVRQLLTAGVVADISLGFSCLKHFTLDEWDKVYGLILRSGKMTLTSIFMSETDQEDEHHGFPHTSVTLERVERVADEHGHEVIDVFEIAPLSVRPEPLVLTQRRATVEIYPEGTDTGFTL